MSEHREELVTWELRGHVALLTLNRPERLNAWTAEMETRYFDLLQRAAETDEVRVIVVTGAGRGFCPGADMEMLQGVEDGVAPEAGGRDQAYPRRVPKPIIAAINGACAGIGLVQALMCDVRFAAEGARFSAAFSRVGLVAEHGISWTLPRLVGPGRALDLLLSSRMFDAEEAGAIGLVERVLPADRLLEEALAYAETLAANASPTAMALIKRQVYEHASVTLDEAIRQSDVLMQATLAGKDFQEGVASFVDKRAPDFASLDHDTYEQMEFT